MPQSFLAAIFTEWDRRYREEPERFQSEAVRLLKETPQSYGDAAAPYFLQIAKELGYEIDVSDYGPDITNPPEERGDESGG